MVQPPFPPALLLTVLLLVQPACPVQPDTVCGLKKLTAPGDDLDAHSKGVHRVILVPEFLATSVSHILLWRENVQKGCQDSHKSRHVDEQERNIGLPGISQVRPDVLGIKVEEWRKRLPHRPKNTSGIPASAALTGGRHSSTPERARKARRTGNSSGRCTSAWTTQ